MGSAIREFLKTYHLEEKLNETRAIHAWGKVVGRMANIHTTSLKIRNSVLYVKLDSPSLRNELTFSREKIISELNREAGERVISDIVFS